MGNLSSKLGWGLSPKV